LIDIEGEQYIPMAIDIIGGRQADLDHLLFLLAHGFSVVGMFTK